MAAATALLALPIPEASRRVALAQLNRWVLQARCLATSKDPEALHSYRTAVRRLRCLLRTFRPWLTEVPRRSRRRLRRLMRLTGPSRNLEVLLEWIARQQPQLTRRQRAGARWLSRRLEMRLSRANRGLFERLSQLERGLERSLRKGLGGKPSRSLGEGAGIPRAGIVVRRLIRWETDVLNHRLSAITTMSDQSAIHSARIAVKRVRYLLEPVAAGLPNGTQIVDRLRELQDLVGGITDAHVAADELRDALIVASAGRAERLGRQILPWPVDKVEGPVAPPPGAQSGLIALARLLREEGDRCFGRLVQWGSAPRTELVGLLRQAGEVHRGGRI
jgi:CHAD domain-containing protein